MYGFRPAIVVGFAFMLLFLSSAACAQSVNEVLDAVNRNVKEFQETLPDFVCNERITSTELDDGLVVKEKVVESVFTGLQRSNIENRVRFAFTESRDPISIDGKAVRKG